MKVDWIGAEKRHNELSTLLHHLERLPVVMPWEVETAITSELKIIPHPNWIRPHVVVDYTPKES